MNWRPAIYPRTTAVWTLEPMEGTGPETMPEIKTEETGKAKMWSEAKRARIRIRGLRDLQRPNPSCPALEGLPRVCHKA